MFESTERNIAIAPAAVPSTLSAMLAQYGEDMPDGPRQIRTLAAHWDDGAHTRMRAASLTDGTITGQPLTDGRVVFRALWQADAAAAFGSGAVHGVEELTDAQVLALTPQPETPAP